MHFLEIHDDNLTKHGFSHFILQDQIKLKKTIKECE